MSENKTQPTTASVERFLSTLEGSRRTDAERLVDLMRAASGAQPVMWGPAIIGFGSYHYRYESGREGDIPWIGFSPRKAGLVLYNVLCGTGALGMLARLGKHSTGKGCLYIKKLSDVDPDVLAEVLGAAVTAVQEKHGV